MATPAIDTSRPSPPIPALNRIQTQDLGNRPTELSFDARSLNDRVAATRKTEENSNTMQMGVVMLSRGVDIGAVAALVEKIGPQNGEFNSSTGTIRFESDKGVSVTVIPILGATQRGQAQGLSEKNNYPVAWVQAGDTLRLASYNRDTAKLENEVIRPKDLSDHATLSKDVHLLRGIDAMLIGRGVSSPARLKFLGYLEKHGVTHVITDKARGVFQVTRKSGVNVSGQVLRGGRLQGQEVPAILTIDDPTILPIDKKRVITA